MPTLETTDFNILTALLGGFISVFGLVSYLVKENFYLSEALISLIAGVVFYTTNCIRPLDYARGSQENLNDITLYFSRLVLGVQLVLAGIQLPSRYLKKEWKALGLLLGPTMALMWLGTSLLIWALVPHLPYLHALAIAASVTPTDPVLSNVIVKGRFADSNVPKELQKVIIAESGANDGLGYPFLYFALYLIKYTGGSSHAAPGGVLAAMSDWFGEIWGYTILLSVVYGAVVGWLAKECLHFAEDRKWVDRESFLVFALSLALFITGTCGMIGSDDVLACFIAGNTFTWDDWFRLETLDDSLQPTIDMLLNVAIFMWFGAVCPWSTFLKNEVVPINRLVPLGILVLLFRRPPVILGMHRLIHQVEDVRQAIFMGFFGPVGVSGVFYLYITLGFLKTLQIDGQQREDVKHLGETAEVVIWFIAICSVVIHGLSIPLGKFGFYLPRTLSRSMASPGSGNENSTFFRTRGRAGSLLPPFRNPIVSRNSTEPNSPAISGPTSGRPVSRIRGRIIEEDGAKKRGNGTDNTAGILASDLSAGSSCHLQSCSTAALPNSATRLPDEGPPSGERSGVSPQSPHVATCAAYD